MLDISGLRPSLKAFAGNRIVRAGGFVRGAQLAAESFVLKDEGKRWLLMRS
jgi:hypothetical protein